MTKLSRNTHRCLIFNSTVKSWTMLEKVRIPSQRREENIQFDFVQDLLKWGTVWKGTREAKGWGKVVRIYAQHQCLVEERLKWDVQPRREQLSYSLSEEWSLREATLLRNVEGERRIRRTTGFNLFLRPGSRQMAAAGSGSVSSSSSSLAITPTALCSPGESRAAGRPRLRRQSARSEGSWALRGRPRGREALPGVTEDSRTFGGRPRGREALPGVTEDSRTFGGRPRGREALAGLLDTPSRKPLERNNVLRSWVIQYPPGCVAIPGAIIDYRCDDGKKVRKFRGDIGALR